MRVLVALAALAAVAAATRTTKAPGCQADFNCERGVEFCSKPENSDGTQRRGFCAPRPTFGQRCGSSRMGLTTKCMDGLTCEADGCCGGCSSTRPRTTGPRTTGASTTGASTTRASTTVATTPGYPIEYTKKDAICGGVKLSDFDNTDTGLGFDVLSKFGKKKNKATFLCERPTQTCWARCKPTSGFVYKGTVQVRCTTRGWEVRGKKCRRHSRKTYGRKPFL